MFAKLLKHEFKAQAGLFAILSGAVLAAGLFGSLMMRIIVNTAMDSMSQQSGELRTVMGTVFPMFGLMAIIFAVAAYTFAVMLILYYRFYKHHFSDEGYLTFTLPATTHQILLASIANIVIWAAITVAVTAVAALLIVLPIFTLSEFYAGESVREAFKMIFEEFGVGFTVLNMVSTLCTAFGSMILVMLSITLGSIVVKKYKLLAGIGIYYGINLVVSAVTGAFNTLVFFSEIAISAETGSLPGVLTMLLPAVLYLGIGIGGYFLMHYLVDEKLNLP